MKIGERVKDNLVAIGATFIALIAIFSGMLQLDTYLAKQKDLETLTKRVRLNELDRRLSKVSTRYFEQISLLEKSPSKLLDLEVGDLFELRKSLQKEIQRIENQL